MTIPEARQRGGLYRTARRALRGVAALSAAGAVGIGVLLASLWVEHRGEVTLPTPTGPLAVGRTTLVWADGSADPRAPVPGTARELLVWIWYPAVAGAGAVMDDYVPAPMRAADERASAGGARADPPPLVVRLLTPLVGLLTKAPANVRGHSLRDARVSPAGSSYPVVLMRAGASSGVVGYSTLAEDLASHGYVVVGLDAPYRTWRVVFPDGRVIDRTRENDLDLHTGPELQRVGNELLAAWTADLSFAVDRLEELNVSDPSGIFGGRLDLSRLGAFGHSFGGAQAAQFCAQDPRCSAGIDVDGAPFGSVVRTGMAKPFMFLLSDHGHASDSTSRAIEADIQSIYERLPPDRRLRVAIRGANHFTFSDDGALLKSRLFRGALRSFGGLRIGGRRQLAVTTFCVRTFFDAYLGQGGAGRPAMASPLYPEVEVLE